MSESTMLEIPRFRRHLLWLFAPGSWRGVGAVYRRWLTLVVSLTFVSLMPAQEALRSSMAGDAAVEARHRQSESLPYTIKSGDFRMLVTPSLGLDFNDNINSAESNPQSDFILRPMLQFNLSYPVTQNNLLNLNLGVGYDHYFQHSGYDGFRLQSGSELSFDMYVHDVWINFHDRFSYSQDSAQQSAVANTAQYGTINNTAGLLVTWDLSDVTMSLGYDHENVTSPAQEFQSQDRATEMITSRVGFKLHPRLTAGIEATASFTRYDQLVLNDNSSYSVGTYADWQPGSYLHVQPRLGYTIYQFQQTSQTNRTSDVNSWYADLTVRHDISEIASYSLSAGHEIRLGVQSDANDVWYLRPAIDWRIIKNTTLNTALFYEHGKQGVGNLAGNLTETYDWYGGSIAVSHALTDRLNIALNYRLTLRSSDAASRGYTQNLVGLLLTYQLP